jgi:prophage maintenance system killer protein
MVFFVILNAMDTIIVNRKFCEDLGEPYGLDHPEILQKILDEYRTHDSIEDEKEKVIQKATCLLAGLVFYQPFKNGNKRTSLSISRIMMKTHHHTINGYETDAIQEEVYNLLNKTMMKMEGDPTIKTEIEDYLRENLIKI